MPIATQIIRALVGIFAPLRVKTSCVVVLGSVSNLNTDTDFETNANDSYIG
jgi:hypothetical protein